MTVPSGRNRSDGHELWPPRLAGRRAPGGQRCAQRAGRVSEARRGRQWRPNRLDMLRCFWVIGCACLGEDEGNLCVNPMISYDVEASYM